MFDKHMCCHVFLKKGTVVYNTNVRSQDLKVAWEWTDSMLFTRYYL